MASGAVAAHYETRALKTAILDAIEAAGLDCTQITPDDLAPLEEFHTLGRPATIELAELAGVTRASQVLDVGAGLAGPARLLAARYGVHVTALDLTAAYCEAARMLNQLTGLSDLVQVRQGDALDLPFADASFDLVWTQHASMNIADKSRLYSEISRVLTPDGRFAMFDIVAGEVSPIHFPVPWAGDPSISFLESIDQMHSLLLAAGFTTLVWEDLTARVLAFSEGRAVSARGAPTAIGLHLLAPDMPDKLANQARNVRERRVRFLRAVLTR